MAALSKQKECIGSLNPLGKKIVSVVGLVRWLCSSQKNTSKFYAKVSSSREKKLLEVIHSDVCEPMQSTTFSGKRNFVTFTDKYTHLTIVFRLQNKSEFAN